MSGLVVYALVAKLLDAQQWVTHTQDVQSALNNVRALNGRTNRDRTEYISSGDQRFAQEFQTAIGQRDQAVQRVRALSADNPTEQKNCDQLESLMVRLSGLLSKSIELRANGQSDLEAQLVFTRQIADVSAEIDSLLEQMNNLEQGLLEHRRSDTVYLFRATVIILFISFVFAIALLLVHYRLLEAELNGRAAAETKFRTLMESAPDALLVVDGKGNISLVNSQAERLFGYQRKELIGREIEMLIPQRFRGIDSRQRANFLQQAQLRPMGAGLDLYGLHKDGHEFPVEISLSPMKTEAGMMVTSAIRDVSQRKAFEAAMKAQAALLDAANDAIWAADLEEKITYWNKGAERLYGWTREEAIGKSPHDLLRTEFPVPFEEVARRRTEGGWQGELVHTKRDGNKVTVASSWTRLEDPQNNLAGWLQINTDISGQKRSEQSLRILTGRLLRMQDEERRRIARELHDSAGQVLAAISMNLTPLETADGLAKPNAIEKIQESLVLVKELSSELRTISHLLHPPLLDEVGLASALRVYLDGFTERSKIDVEFDIPDDFGRFSQELETAIFRIVQECLTNIHRHSGSPVAKISVSHADNQVRLQIEDKGTGIPTEKRKAMDSVGSPGVGISGMRERIRQLGGSLEIYSQAKSSDGAHQGTVITALLPVSHPSSISAA